MSNIAQNIKKIRERVGLTQTEFALSIGVAQGTLSRIEKGTDVVQINMLENIAGLYKVSMDWLLLNKGTDWDEQIPTKQEIALFLAEQQAYKAQETLHKLRA
jgi:transcriptional regulator with XRE-family HTH domain